MEIMNYVNADVIVDSHDKIELSPIWESVKVLKKRKARTLTK